MRARIFDEKNEFNLVFIDNFDQMFEMYNFAKIKNFDGRNEKRRKIANNLDFVFITNSLTKSFEQVIVKERIIKYYLVRIK